MERRKQTKSYYSPLTGNLFSDISKVHKLDKGDILQAISTCDTDILYTLPQHKGVFINPESQYVTKSDLMGMGVQIVKWYDDSGKVQVNGRELDIIPIKRWFDTSVHTTLKDVIIAMQELEKILNEKFVVGHSASVPIEILETPTRTGMDILKRKLPFDGRYESLPDDIEHIVIGNFSQQRREYFTHDYVIDDLYCYDGRLEYAACCRDIPIGAPIHDNEDKHVPYVPALYRALFTIPSNWQHIGLLPVKANLKGVASIYPNEPKQEHETWCSTYEMQTALKYGWDVSIKERVLWLEGKEKGFKGKDPLKHWVNDLVELREVAIPQRYEEPIRSLLKGAIRHLIIDTIGALHSSERTIDVYSDDITDMYELGYIPDFDGVQYHAKIKKEMNAYQRSMYHPHWSLDIWSKAKDKITKCALSVPYEQLLLIRADAIWTQGKQQHLKDDGKVGTFREKPLLKRGVFTMPRTENNIRRMMSQAKGE